MILLDTNLLVYARVASLPQHARAHAWLDEQLNGDALVGLPWPSLLGFLRLVTSLRVFQQPDNIASAWRQVEAWLGCPNTWIPQPTENHGAVLASLLARLGGGANLVPDAHLAALAIEHGLTLCTTDGDFARFAGLKWVNPLATGVS